MSTTSQHLGLKINDGSDPFLLADFTNNWGLLDEFPGTWICTSTTRPSWGAGQNGMMIVETDTRRNMLWTGTTWREMLTGPAVWWGSLRLSFMIGRSTTANYVVGTFTVNRPGTLLAITTTELGAPSNGYIEGNLRSMIDGSQANWDGSSFGEYFKYDWANTGTSDGQNDFGTTITTLGVRTISEGTHSVGIQLQTSTPTSQNTQIRITSCRAMAMFVNGTDR